MHGYSYTYSLFCMSIVFKPRPSLPTLSIMPTCNWYAYLVAQSAMHTYNIMYTQSALHTYLYFKPSLPTQYIIGYLQWASLLLHACLLLPCLLIVSFVVCYDYLQSYSYTVDPRYMQLTLSKSVQDLCMPIQLQLVLCACLVYCLCLSLPIAKVLYVCLVSLASYIYWLYYDYGLYHPYAVILLQVYLQSTMYIYSYT